MKNTVNTLAIVLAISLGTLGCEGPAGPQGLIGEQGIQGEKGLSGMSGITVTSISVRAASFTRNETDFVANYPVAAITPLAVSDGFVMAYWDAGNNVRTPLPIVFPVFSDFTVNFAFDYAPGNFYLEILSDTGSPELPQAFDGWTIIIVIVEPVAGKKNPLTRAYIDERMRMAMPIAVEDAK
jgi:hypothetical protein